MEIVTDKSTIEIDFVKGTIIDLVKKNIILKLDGDLMSESYYEQMKFWIKSIDEKDLSINNLLDSKKLLESIL